MWNTCPWRPRRPATILLLLLFGVGPPACVPAPVRLSFTIESDANNNSPVTMSVIVAYEAPVVEKLLALSAKQWFHGREQFLRDHQKAVEEALWEFVPGQQVPPFSRKLKKTPKQGIIFANYRSPGPHRYLFDPARPVQLLLGQKALILPP